jgi:hypothetical protein
MRDDFPKVVNQAGNVVGLADKRPEKRGSNGRFYLTRYELCAPTPEKPLPEPEMIGFEDWSDGSMLELPEKKTKKQKGKLNVFATR